MAKKAISKIEQDLEQAKARVSELEEQRKLALEDSDKKIGRAYVQLKQLENKALTREAILAELKEDILLAKDYQKESKKPPIISQEVSE
ncbi:hypothetical protein [Streptococcus dysgalactiae]|uniref:Uncharacterized protein n=1 Tax=Streptococcus dysgalactiae subsp. equisimilis TaxID=119602 RepID=A0AB38Y0Q1_STREQ|nr:hypothetical protein [Streptococcus dysgalactiae]HEN6156938.1 hypothetical protein [Streptococcus agalactiae]HER1343180.1 hypothetical protein [Streptococcus pyogenes]MCY7206032.1 hypothetical protein [Streptococcus dysgalactiae]OBY99448.1 hypothetical protein BBG01_03600 [Streptococcus dysgalactiae subsp. equisimilis]OCX04777.1 hypothetical protein GCS_02400 [Streptococcus dysgalactiae subsp. equisimilis AKSDE4288]